MNGARAALFDIRRGELGPLLRAGGALAMILLAHTLAETARDAMFLTRLSPSRLAIAYGLLALLALLALRANATVIRRVGRRKALVTTLAIAACGELAFYLVPPSAASVLAFYLWTGLVAAVVIVQFWLVIGETFTSAEAKRLYGPILALGGAGGLAGALGATAVLTVLRVEQLLPIAGTFFVLAAVLIVGGRPTHASAGEVAPAPPDHARLRDHPYALRLAALVGLATALALVLDYLFKAGAARALAPDDLAGFFARYNGVVAAASLALQLVGAAWLIRKLGVLGTVILIPAVLLLGGLAIAATARTFGAVVLTKVADTALRQSVQRVSLEMLWMPVAAEQRGPLRERIDGVGFRVAQGLTASALLGINLLASAGVVLAIVALGLAALWLALAVRLRGDYLAQLRRSVGTADVVVARAPDTGAFDAAVEALGSAEPRRVLAALEVLKAHDRAHLIPPLVLHHDDPAVLLAALDAVALAERRDWIPLAEHLLAHADAPVRVAALRALARAGVTTAVEAALDDPDPGVRGHALFWHAQHARAPDAPVAAPALVILAAGADVETRTALLDAIRTSGDPQWTAVVLQLLRDPHPVVAEAAARAIERAPDPRFVPPLIERLAVRAIRPSVRAALLAIGAPALPTLGRALRDPAQPEDLRRQLPPTLAVFASQAAADLLMAALVTERSGAVRARILRALAHLAVNHQVELDRPPLLAELRRHLRAHFRLLALATALAPEDTRGRTGALLRDLVREEIHQARGGAFVVIQALHPGEDVGRIERVIARDDGIARAHALELLDTLTRSPVLAGPDANGLRDALLLACEELPAAERVQRVGDAFAPHVASSTQALARLIHEPDALLAAIAAYHALQLGRAELTAVVRAASAERPLLAPLGLASEELPRG